MSGSGGRRSGARCFFRPPGRQTSVLPALMLDLSIVVIFGKSPALERSQLPMHRGHRHTSLQQRASLAEACLAAPCNTFAVPMEERRWEETKKGKLESSCSQWRQDQAQKEGKPADTSARWLQRELSHCPAGSKNSVWVVVATLPWCSHSHPGLGMKALSGSCHSQCLRELPRLGTEESRASRTGNQGIAVDATCPNKIKPEALAVALPLLIHTVVTLSQWPCQEWG